MYGRPIQSIQSHLTEKKSQQTTLQQHLVGGTRGYILSHRDVSLKMAASFEQELASVQALHTSSVVRDHPRLQEEQLLKCRGFRTSVQVGDRKKTNVSKEHLMSVGFQELFCTEFLTSGTGADLQHPTKRQKSRIKRTKPRRFIGTISRV